MEGKGKKEMGRKGKGGVRGLLLRDADGKGGKGEISKGKKRRKRRRGEKEGD